MQSLSPDHADNANQYHCCTSVCLLVNYLGKHLLKHHSLRWIFMPQLAKSGRLTVFFFSGRPKFTKLHERGTKQMRSLHHEPGGGSKDVWSVPQDARDPVPEPDCLRGARRVPELRLQRGTDGEARLDGNSLHVHQRKVLRSKYRAVHVVTTCIRMPASTRVDASARLAISSCKWTIQIIDLGIFFFLLFLFFIYCGWEAI